MSNYEQLKQLKFDVMNTPPSKVCLICDKLEFPNAKYMYRDAAWLCDDCKRRLMVLTRVDKEPASAIKALMDEGTRIGESAENEIIKTTAAFFDDVMAIVKKRQEGNHDDQPIL